MTYQELYDMVRAAGCEDWPVFFRSKYAEGEGDIEEGVNIEPWSGNQMVIEG